MRRQSGTTLLAVILLAVAIGLNTSLMAVLNGLLLRPWPGVGAGRDVVALYLSEPRPDSTPPFHDIRGFTRAHWQFLVDHTTSLASLSAFHRDVVQLGPEGSLGPAGVLLVSGNFFDTLQIAMPAGRGFHANEDRLEMPRPVAVLSTRIWRARFAADPSMVGRSVVINGQPFVIGVTRDAHLNTSSAVEPMIFTPFTTAPVRAQPQLPKLLFRSDRPDASDSIKRAASRIDPELTIRAARLTATIKADFMNGPGYYGRMLAQVLGVFALALATVGMFGVFAYAVRQRTREIGVRMALGARGPAILRLILVGHSRVVLVGLGSGLLGAVVLSIVLRSSLPGVARFDARVYAAVGFLLGVAALAASYLPARRAIHVDPALALRCE